MLKKYFREINIVTLLMLFLEGSCVVVNDVLPSVVTIALWLVVFLFLALRTKSVDFRIGLIFLSLIVLMWASVLINGENLLNAAKHTFAFLTAFLYVNRYKFEDAKKSFSDVMTLLAVVSLVLFPLFVFVDPMSNLFVFYVKSHKFSNMFLYVHNIGMNRNCGFFWEPGAYQTFLNIALIIELAKEKKDIKRILLFTVTIITTFSTSGFIGLFIAYAYFVFSRHRVSEKAPLFAVLFIAVPLLAVILFGERIFEGGENGLFGKIVHFFEESDFIYIQGKNLTTAAIRYFSIVKPLELFLANPLFGIGYDTLRTATYDYTHGAISCTFVNWFAMYGVFFGAIMSVGYSRLALRKDESTIAKILLIVFLAVIVMSEDYSHSPFFFGIVFYGFLMPRIKKEKARAWKANYCTQMD